MDYTPLISVIVPVYNVQPYLEKALNSIIRQTLKEIQIILVDDGSDDGSLDICYAFAQKDKRIQIIENVHRGVAVARNAGLNVAVGDYVAFIDADDWLEADMFEYLYRNAVYYKTDISTCEIFREYPGRKPLVKGSHKDYLIEWVEAVKEMNYNGDFDAFLFNKIFKRSLLDEIRFPEGVSIGEDYTFIIKFLLKRPSVFRGSACKYHYRQQPNSISYTGFSNSDAVSRNRENYRNIYLFQIGKVPVLGQSALAYYILQEMAVAISMVKAKRYDKSILSSVKQVIRRNLKKYIKIRKVPVYLKICAALLSINEAFLLLPYRTFFHRFRSVSGI